MTVELDSYDRKILFELDCDSRRPLSEVARSVRLGRDLVTYRLERLHSAGVLRGCSALINPYKLGFTLYKVYLKLEANRERANLLIETLNRHHHTFWLAESYGRWDLIWCFAARSPKEAFDIQNSLFSEYHDVIPHYSVYTFVNNWWFPKKHLLGSSLKDVQGWNFQMPTLTLGTTPAQHELDALESQLVALLSRNARLTIVELAERLGATPAVVKYRLEKLERTGVVAGYRVDIDRSLLGMTLFNVQIQPRDYDAAKEREFLDYCRAHPQVLEYIQQLGDCRAELVLEARDYNQFSAVMDHLRERFSLFIRGLDYLMIKKDYFHRTPACLYHHQHSTAGLAEELAA
jgi:Lrp/AsnC family leucine-responsive transcriptional regulator